MDVLLWQVLPYVCIATFVVGHWWRYKYDKFGWTTRSSQMYESKLLQIGSPLFHFGILVVLAGHVMGLVIPKRWTEAVGITQEMYHVMAVALGAIAGFCTIVGMIILIYRRRMTPAVFSATTANDKIMYVFLAAAILTGLANTVLGNVVSHYDYREGVSIWFRELFYLSPNPDHMTAAPLTFQMHTLLVFLLFALWPFTRLVHVFSAPLSYMWRPYVVYRSRLGSRLGASESRRGWERSELKRSAADHAAGSHSASRR
ncbi:respiratory nitrate reductase subunit gamma [Mobilicoccus caccae]|uniref:Nitrate reductase subunit gamma n=1 Tax=Mobilicoccus caccae TaxID=1859295 RepID=A0ABQ6IUX1_9MICO|nr:respiratory nitrate reductase subunit gamma [Mobilicoccus caccae]GMA41284.1 nitrate reductase subunit gamma [Mobilicoccus caccae]